MSKYINIIFLLSFLWVSSNSAQEKTILNLEYNIKKLPFGLTEKVPVYTPDISLVLSGGGARSVAQIGVLKALNERNIPISRIFGTSMGSIIGGLYSAGYTVNDLDSLVKVIPWDELLTVKDESKRTELFIDQKITEDKALFALRLDGLNPILPTSINTGEVLANYLNLLVLNAPIHVNNGFDELKIKFQAVCTDLVSGKVVVLSKGSLSQAMRASSSVSLFVAPVRVDSFLLVDGGLVANIPVKLAKDSGTDYIIAFNTTSPLNTLEELSYPWNVADQLVSIPVRLLSLQQLEYANTVIEPQLGKKRNTDFTNLDSLVEVGYKTTLAYLDTIENNIDKIFKSKIKEKEFYVKNILYNDSAEPFEKPYLFKYSLKDSVSSYELYHDLNTIFMQGNFEKLQMEIVTERYSSGVRFIGKQNPEIKQVEMNGVTILDSYMIDSVFHEILHKPYNSKKISKILTSILSSYRNSGYSLADIEEVSFSPHTGRLFIKVSEGRISKIEIEGNVKTSTSIIRREIPLGEGDFFLYNKLQEGFANLRSTNLFQDINFIFRGTGENKTLLVRVLEKNSSLMRFGLRIDNENKTQLSLDIRDENLFGTGTELGFILSGGIRNRSYILEHKANRVFETYLTYKIRAFHEFNDVYTYKDDSVTSNRRFSRSVLGEYRQIFTGLAVGIGAQFRRLGNIIVEGKYAQDQIKNLSNLSGGTYKINLTSLRVLSTIDSQDKYPYPRKGVLVKTSYETAQKLLGGDVSYTKFYFDYQSFFSFNQYNTIHPRFAVGYADNTLPLSQLFSLGGQNNFFGLREYEFRGRQILLSSLEYRFKLPVKIFFDSYLQLRYDLGSIWSTREEIRFKDLKHGTGFTLSLDTPLGPADFSAGRSFQFKGDLSSNGIAWGPVYFYFTIGYYY